MRLVAKMETGEVHRQPIAIKTTTTVVSISHFHARWEISAFKVRHSSFAVR